MKIELLFNGAYTVVLLAIGAAGGAYLKQKGRNLATKEDIGKITDKVEEVRRSHREEIEKVSSELAKTVHVHRAQFLTELRAYRAVWKTLVEAKRATLQLRPVAEAVPEDESEEERRERKLEEFSNAFEEFRNTVDRWRPFYPKEIYDKFNELLLVIRDEGVEYGTAADKPYDGTDWESARQNALETIRKINGICEAIRERMEALSVADR